MDATKVILTLIKDDQIRQGLNPLVYYALKLMYNSEFSKRSKYFGLAIKRLFDELANNLNLQIATLDSNLMAAENTMTFDMSIVDDIGPAEPMDKKDKNAKNDKNENNIKEEEENPLNVTANKDVYNSVNKLIFNTKNNNNIL